MKNFVTNAKIDPKVVMDLSIFQIGGWNSVQPSDRKLLEEFIDENEPWLLIGIPSRDPFLLTRYLERHSVSSDQYMKNLMSLREGLHVIIQCYMRQNLADRYWLHEHPKGHASWREPTMRKFTKESTTYFCERTCMQMECSEDDDQNRVSMFRRQRVSSQTVGESKIALERRACTGSSGENLDESWMHADCVVEHTSSEIDCSDSEGAS